MARSARSTSNLRSKPLKSSAILHSVLGADVASSKEEFLRQSRISLLYSAAIEGKDRQKEQIVQLEFRRSALKEHKFQIGETVYFTSRPIGHMAANSTYQVVRLLPSDGADYRYRIKNANEAFERVARESQLENSL